MGGEGKKKKKKAQKRCAFQVGRNPKGVNKLKTVMYSSSLPRNTISVDVLGLRRWGIGPERVVPAVAKEATSVCDVLRTSASCQICTLTLDMFSVDLLWALLSLSSRAAEMSRTTL